MVRSTLCLLVVLFSGLAQALPFDSDPAPLQGLFQWTETVQPVMKMDVQVPLASTTKGRAQLENLRKRGYQCKHVQRMMYRCQKNFRIDSLPDGLSTRFAKKISDQQWVSFEIIDPAMEKEINGKAFEVWRVFQNVETDHLRFSDYEMWRTPQNQKVVFRDDPDGDIQLEFNRESDVLLNRQLTVSRTLTRFHFQIFVARLPYLRTM